jgi:hypothetical protein
MKVLRGTVGAILMACCGAALAQSAGNGMRYRTADAADGGLFFESVVQGHLVDTCKRLSPELSPQLAAAWEHWQQERRARLRNGRAYSLKVMQKRGSNEQQNSDELKEGIRSRMEPQIAAEPQTRCTAILEGIKGDDLYKDPVLPVPTRGTTLAGATLSMDVFRKVQVEASCLEPELAELLVLERTPTLIREQWILHGCGKVVPLLVTLKPSPVPGTTLFEVRPDTSVAPAGK